MSALHGIVAGVVALAYAGCFIAIDLGLAHAPPLRFAGLRAALAGGVLIGTAGMLGRGLLPPPRLRRWVPALSAVLAAQYAAMFLSPGAVGAGLASVLANTGPIFLVLLAPPLLGERIGRRSAAAVAVGAVGVGLIAWPEQGAALGGALGVALPLAVASGAALETILLKRARPGADLLALAGWQLLVGAPPLLLLSAIAGEAAIDWTGRFTAALAFLALPGTAVGLALWYWLVQREPVSRLAGFMFLVPVVGLLMAWAVLGESVSVRQGMGLAAALGGILLVTWGDSRRSESPAPAESAQAPHLSLHRQPPPSATTPYRERIR